MKFTTGIKIIISVLLVWQSCLAEEVKTYQADVCVYGGTASGVMAALAAKKEGAKVILIEPTRYLGGMTGGGIHHLDWGKGNTVGGSTFRLLTNGLKNQGKRRPYQRARCREQRVSGAFQKGDRYSGNQSNLRTSPGKCPSWRKDNRTSNAEETDCFGREIFLKEKRKFYPLNHARLCTSR